MPLNSLNPLHITTRIQRLNTIAQLRSLSAQTKGGGYGAAKGVEIIRARSSIPLGTFDAGWLWVQKSH